MSTLYLCSRHVTVKDFLEPHWESDPSKTGQSTICFNLAHQRSRRPNMGRVIVARKIVTSVPFVNGKSISPKKLSVTSVTIFVQL